MFSQYKFYVSEIIILLNIKKNIFLRKMGLKSKGRQSYIQKFLNLLKSK